MRLLMTHKYQNSNQPEPDYVSKKQSHTAGYRMEFPHVMFLYYNLMLSITSLLRPSAFTLLLVSFTVFMNIWKRLPEAAMSKNFIEWHWQARVKWYWFKCCDYLTMLLLRHHRSFFMSSGGIFLSTIQALLLSSESELNWNALFYRLTYNRQKLFFIKLIAHEVSITNWTDEFSWSNGILQALKSSSSCEDDEILRIIGKNEKRLQEPEKPSRRFDVRSFFLTLNEVEFNRHWRVAWCMTVLSEWNEMGKCHRL